MGGLLSEKYIDAPPPDPVAGDPDLESWGVARSCIAHVGGWAAMQHVLGTVMKIALKHGVTI